IRRAGANGSKGQKPCQETPSPDANTAPPTHHLHACDADEIITTRRVSSRPLGTDRSAPRSCRGLFMTDQSSPLRPEFIPNRLVAVFDNDPGKVGRRQGAFPVQPLSELAATIRAQNIRLGILAVPADVAQDVADQLVEAGIRGLLNFAPVSLTVPPDVALNAVDLAVQLEQISFQVSLSLIHKAS